MSDDAITTLLAKDAIRELLAEYCFRLDAYALTDLAALFTPDGMWISRSGEASGRDLAAFMAGLVPPPGTGTRRKHLTTNIVIALAGSQATIVSNFIVVRETAAGPSIAVAGTYHDVLVRVHDQWLFQRRELLHDIAGESGLQSAPNGGLMLRNVA